MTDTTHDPDSPSSPQMGTVTGCDKGSDSVSQSGRGTAASPTDGPEPSAAAPIDWDDVADDALCLIRARTQGFVREAAEGFYATALEAVQDYFINNAEFNIRSRLEANEAERRSQWERAEAAQAQCDELLAAAQDAYRFISQPQRMQTPAANGPTTATYVLPTGAYNAITAQLRAAIKAATGEA